ncbi:MAG: N-acetylmuramoyl-L-alanine amidase [Prevotellaceae bacterium]|nr:N-acetylmuramoyl-L-alanine amidase [Prevotellaceae bacterium]
MSEEEFLERIENGLSMHSPLSVRYLILHCSATRCDQDYTAQQLKRDHKARGFRTVGYHFYVRKDGSVTQHRRLWEVGAHCRPYNRCSIGICYEGGLDEEGQPKDTRTSAQTNTLRHIFASLKTIFPDALICGHRDLPGTTPKACPCLDTAAVFGGIE